ncbi:MAG: OmpA family protein [Deltaproteobacteria bacterium]|nr:OmpA family protein [Deltaproteobacteria bacterium]
MSRRTSISFLPVLAAALAVGCGIPEEEHNKTLDQLKNLRANLAAEQKSCAEAKSELETKHKKLDEQARKMRAKLISLGQDLTASGVAITQKEQQIAELLKAQEQAKQRAAFYAGLVAKFKQMIDSGKLKVEVRSGKMIVKMSDQILFDPGKAKLKKEGSVALLEVARILGTIPDRAFQVAGHTDNVPIKTAQFASNWELSTARAANVVKFMSDNGLDPKRLSAAGYAEHDPVAGNDTPAGRQLNRRIEITLMPNLDELPKIGE